MSKIITLCGSKQSGKSSAAKFLTGYFMQRAGNLKKFEIDDDGNLIVNTKYINAEGQEIEGMGIMDIYRMDSDFIRYAINNIWPNAKVYSFAFRLKQTLEIVFGIPHENLYGTEEQKNELSHLKWEDMPDKPNKKGQMSYRQVAQHYGTEICRKMMDDCWIQACYADILAEDFPIAIIDDCRFPNEAKFMKDKGAKLIKLTKKIDFDKHESEVAMNELPDSFFDAVIDNTDLTIGQKNEKLLEAILKWGY